MKTSVVLTLIGPDRPGLVSAVAARASAACNVAARLAQISGIFGIAAPSRITPSTQADPAARTPPSQGCTPR